MAPTPARVKRDELLAHVLDTLDECGLSGFSMRALASRMGVQAASLYGHVQNRQELLVRVSDFICEEAVRGVAGGSWQSGLSELALQLRSVLAAHPGAVAVVASQPISAPTAGRLAPLLASLAEQMQCTAVEASFAVQSVYLFTSAHALAQHGDPPSEPSREGAYYDAWFEFALTTFLQGLAAFVDAAPGARPPPPQIPD